MGASNTSSSALNLWGGTRGAHVVMVGLDASGKTTILYQLKENRKVVTTPTIGCNVETIEEPFVGLPLTLWDLRGLGQARNFYRTFYLQKEAFVFVLDSSDLDRIAEVAEELQLLASDANLTRLPCLVLANKQDLPGALTPTQVAQALDLHQVFKEERRWHIQGCCAAENRGLRPGFAWLANEIIKRRQNLEEIYYDCKSGSREISADSSLGRPWNLFSLFQRQKREARVLMIGLDGSGKTTILYQLKEGRRVVTMPTIGFNLEQVEVDDLLLSVWDVRGGCEKARGLWRHYYRNTQGLVLVVDCSATERFDELREVLELINKEELLRNVPVLVLANKQDLPGAVSPQRLADFDEGLDLRRVLQDRRWHVQETSGSDASGIRVGFRWLVSAVKSSYFRE